MNSLPFVSVIVPTHRRPVLLARLLRSLMAQSWPADRMEVIVIHNATPDETAEVVRAAAATAAFPIAYHATDFSGPGPSRQFGAERARGSILAFTDDDCEATPGWIAGGVAGIEQGFALVQGMTVPHPDQPRRLMEKTVSVTGPTPYFETCNIFYDAAIFHALGGFPADFRERFYAEDTALGWTLRRAGHRCGFAPDALVYHEVFAMTPRAWLNEPRNMRQWPYLVRAFPEIRRELFLGLFLSRLTAGFALAALGLLVAPFSAWALLLVLPYVAIRFGERGRYRAPHLLLARLLFGLPRATVLLVTLLVSSFRARSLVL
jgi:GT2 family glycosyltransferase